MPRVDDIVLEPRWRITCKRVVNTSMKIEFGSEQDSHGHGYYTFYSTVS